MRIYEKYKQLKEMDNSKKYLFKAGNFYIFLSADAKEIVEVTTLKLTTFGNTVKCGFPLSSLDKYLSILSNIGMDVVLVENKEIIVNELKNLDLNDLSKEKLISIIDRFKNCV